MLTTLYVKNFIIVDEATIHLKNGFSVITGETGSGKSVILSAIRLAFGAKAESHFVKPKTDSAEIKLSINLSKLVAAKQWLVEEGFDLVSSDIITLSRLLSSAGRSKCTLNGQPITLNQMKGLSSLVLQMHGQHQHQALLKTDEQIRLLDALAQTQDVLCKTNEAYELWLKLCKEKEALEKKSGQSGEIALLRYQVQELNALNLSEEEWEQLSQQHKRLANATSHQQACEKALSLLESDDGLAVLNALHLVDSTVSPLELPNLSSLIDSAKINLSEAIDTLKDQIDHFESDPEALHEVESRLSQIYEVARKHHVSPAALYEHSLELSKSLSQLENLSHTLAGIDDEITKSEESYRIHAKKLSQKRQETALSVSKQITQRLQPLGMSAAEFSISVNFETNNKPHLNGLDKILFCIQTNPEQPLLPLAKIASGGELSRVALAIEALTAEHLNGATLIFDEVDVGIGGQTGITVGSTIKTLAQNCQVLCVTHLPQVAAFADHHYRISKHIQEQKTQFKIELLDQNESIEALALMLGGRADNKQAKAHAKTLLEQASLV